MRDAGRYLTSVAAVRAKSTEALGWLLSRGVDIDLPELLVTAAECGAGEACLCILRGRTAADIMSDADDWAAALKKEDIMPMLSSSSSTTLTI